MQLGVFVSGVPAQQEAKHALDPSGQQEKAGPKPLLVEQNSNGEAVGVARQLGIVRLQVGKGKEGAVRCLLFRPCRGNAPGVVSEAEQVPMKGRIGKAGSNV